MTIEMCPASGDSRPNSDFETGQVWTYKTRPGEEASRVLVGKVEEYDDHETIVHVKMVGVHIKNPAVAEGFSSVLGHAPVAAEAFAESVVELTDDPIDLDGFDEGYDSWHAAFVEGEAGVFTITLAEITEYMEQALNQ